MDWLAGHSEEQGHEQDLGQAVEAEAEAGSIPS
jgi:hypothetical protein